MKNRWKVYYTYQDQVYRLEQAIQEIDNGRLSGVQVISRNGRQYLQSYPDGVAKNNLDNLPEF